MQAAIREFLRMADWALFLLAALLLISGVWTIATGRGCPAYPEWDNWSCFEYWLARYQTLIVGVTALIVGVRTLQSMKWERDFQRWPPLLIFDRASADLIALVRGVRGEYERATDLNEAIQKDEDGRVARIRQGWEMLQAMEDFAKFWPMLDANERRLVLTVIQAIDRLSGGFIEDAADVRVETMRELDNVVTQLNGMRRAARLRVL